MATGYHDGNHTPTLVATSSVDGKTPVVVWADPTTHRLLTSSTLATLYTETPTGAIDGVNKTYTVLHTINSIYTFAINGQYIDSSQFSTTGSTITFVTALPAVLSGTAFEIKYQ